MEVPKVRTDTGRHRPCTIRLPAGCRRRSLRGCRMGARGLNPFVVVIQLREQDFRISNAFFNEPVPLADQVSDEGALMDSKAVHDLLSGERWWLWSFGNSPFDQFPRVDKQASSSGLEPERVSPLRNISVSEFSRTKVVSALLSEH